MKKLKLSPQDKQKLIAEFSEQIEQFEDDVCEKTISFEKKLNEQAKDKVTIVFTPDAYLRSLLLVKNFTGEVGWHGLMEKLGDRVYRVYDIMVYPQVVNGARTLDPTKTNEWYDKYDDVIDMMHFQAHSHNTMGTTPSDTDMQNQVNIVKNMQGAGFKLFQIWNKQGDINSFFYDIDNNLLYDRNDINIVIETNEYGTMNDFITDAKGMVDDMPPLGAKPAKLESQKKSEPPISQGYQWKSPRLAGPREPLDDKGSWYWNDGMGREGWN